VLVRVKREDTHLGFPQDSGFSSTFLLSFHVRVLSFNLPLGTGVGSRTWCECGTFASRPFEHALQSLSRGPEQNIPSALVAAPWLTTRKNNQSHPFVCSPNTKPQTVEVKEIIVYTLEIEENTTVGDRKRRNKLVSHGIKGKGKNVTRKRQLA